jgi:hypothetical protein
MAADWSTVSAEGLRDGVVAGLGLAAAWLVGNRISVRWNLRQKEREQDLDAVGRFYATYGEFFAVWKLWSSFPDRGGRVDAPDSERRELLHRSAAMEGALEALLVKLAVERDLDVPARADLARFREGLQCLRESIEKGSVLRTRSSDEGGRKPGQEWKAQGGLAYAALKELAGKVAAIASSAPRRRPDTSSRIPGDVKEVTTSASYRRSWWKQPAAGGPEPAEESSRPPVAAPPASLRHETTPPRIETET